MYCKCTFFNRYWFDMYFHLHISSVNLIFRDWQCLFSFTKEYILTSVVKKWKCFLIKPQKHMETLSKGFYYITIITLQFLNIISDKFFLLDTLISILVLALWTSNKIILSSREYWKSRKNLNFDIFWMLKDSESMSVQAMSVCKPAYLSVCLFACLSVCLSVGLEGDQTWTDYFPFIDYNTNRKHSWYRQLESKCLDST